MSEALKKFLSEWLEWAEAGAPANDAFDRSMGLCNNLGYWLTENILDIPDEEADSVEEEFSCLLADNFGDDVLYPFGGRTKYIIDGNASAHHTNKERLDWVRKQLGK